MKTPKHKWWHCIFVRDLGTFKRTETVNRPGAKTEIIEWYHSEYCDICKKRFVTNYLETK